MPQVQVVDTTQDKPEPTDVERFFTRIGKEYQDKNDRVKIGEIIDEARKNGDEARGLREGRLNLEKANISNSNRVAALKNFDEMEKNLIASSKKTEGAAKEYEKNRGKAVGDYVNAAIVQGKEAQEQKFAIDETRKAIKGDIAGPGLSAALKKTPFLQLFVGLTPDESLLKASTKKLLEGSKGIFGSKPTEKEIFILLDEMLPAIGKTQEANDVGLDFIEKVNEMKALRSRIVEQVTEGGEKYVPNIEQIVNSVMEPAAKVLLQELEQARKEFGGKPNENEKKESKDGKIKVKAPDGSVWNMTQAQIDEAKIQGVNFEPVK